VNALQVAVVGGGWAGLAAAIRATQAGHQVTVFEAARSWGGRARALPCVLPNGTSALLDNGQHILIGAYTDTLALMRQVGVDPQATLLRLPLSMLFPDGQGVRLPDWPMPLDVLAGVLGARGWSLADKWSLLRRTAAWQLAGFACAPELTVADLCQDISPTVLQTLIEPLCVSALNTPPERASAQVFLRVLKDALLGGKGSSNLLLPRTDLSSLFPDAAVRWLASQGATLMLGQRVEQLQHASGWRVQEQTFDAVLWATSSSVASQVLAQGLKSPDQQQNQHSDNSISAAMRAWAVQAAALRFESIATVYLQASNIRLPLPMLALHSTPDHPAQFVFDRGQLDGTPGLLAFVVSASSDDRAVLQAKVLQQARSQLADLLQGQELVALQTVVEKRATFACTPGLQRPTQSIAPGLLACGDYLQGPYPATLEGAVRSGQAAAGMIHPAD
jgi:squalene-associated FAD-dependent desaturase